MDVRLSRHERINLAVNYGMVAGAVLGGLGGTLVAVAERASLYDLHFLHLFGPLSSPILVLPIMMIAAAGPFALLLGAFSAILMKLYLYATDS